MILRALILTILVLFSMGKASADFSTTSLRNDYTAATGNTDFVFGFPVFTKSNITVLVDGVVQILDIDYTVRSGILPFESTPVVTLPTTGFVRFVVARTNGQIISLIPIQAITQLSIYTIEPFPARRIETDYDKGVMISRMLAEGLARTPQLKPGSLKHNLTMDDPVALKFLRWKSDLTGIENTDAAGGGGGAGTVTHTLGSLTANAFILGNGLDDVKALALTGLVLGNGASAPTAYGGSGTCAGGDFITAISSTGVKTCGTAPGAGAITGSGSANRVAFWTTSSNISSDSAFIWDNATKRLGIGVITPGGSLDVRGETLGWMPAFGAGVIRAANSLTINNNNTIIGAVQNDLGASTTSFPTGVTGYGRTNNSGNQAFGIFGRADLYGSSGVATNEFNSDNFNAAPSANLPPDRSIGTAQRHPIALTIASGGDFNSSIAIHIVGEGASPQKFLTGIYIDPAVIVTNALDTPGLTIDVAGKVQTTSQAAIVLGPYGVAANNTGETRFLERAANGTNYVGLTAPDSIAANVVWRLPTADGTSGQCLATDGAKNLSWGTCSAGSGTGISSLNGLSVSVQTFVNDAAITMTSSGSTHTIALLTTGVGAGTYGQVTVNTKGQVTAATTIADIAHGGTGVSDLTFAGNTHKVGTTLGTLINGNCVKIDNANNFVDSGGPCNPAQTVTGTGAKGQTTYWTGTSDITGDIGIIHASAYGLLTSATAAANKTAMNAAIVACNAANGCRLILPGGTYNIDPGVTAFTKAAIVEGVGADALVVAGTRFIVSGAGTLFTVTGVSTWFKHFSITNGTTAIAVSSAKGLWGIVGVIFDAQGTALTIADSDIYVIRASYFTNYTDQGIKLSFSGAGDGGDATIESCTFASNTGDGILWTGGGGLRIINNKFNSSAGGATSGVTLAPANGIATSDIFFTGNSFENQQYGIFMTAAGNGAVSQILLTGNQFALQTVSPVGITSANFSYVTISGGSMAGRGGVSSQVLLSMTAVNIAMVSGVTFVGVGATPIAIGIGASATSVAIGWNQFIGITTNVSNGGSGTRWAGLIPTI